MWSKFLSPKQLLRLRWRPPTPWPRRWWYLFFFSADFSCRTIASPPTSYGSSTCPGFTTGLKICTLHNGKTEALAFPFPTCQAFPGYVVQNLLIHSFFNFTGIRKLVINSHKQISKSQELMFYSHTISWHFWPRKNPVLAESSSYGRWCYSKLKSEANFKIHENGHLLCWQKSRLGFLVIYSHKQILFFPENGHL